MKKKAKHPENLKLKSLVVEKNVSQSELVEAIGYSRRIINETLNGHYKGEAVQQKIQAYLETLNA